jgi:hypothetical protein
MHFASAGFQPNIFYYMYFLFFFRICIIRNIIVSIKPTLLDLHSIRFYTVFASGPHYPKKPIPPSGPSRLTRLVNLWSCINFFQVRFDRCNSNLLRPTVSKIDLYMLIASFDQLTVLVVYFKIAKASASVLVLAHQNFPTGSVSRNFGCV